ncbi:hypothetical protein M569_15693 [Genlisea aurea]|uniref:Uncharacterized protein n=1 Tax=Genlisea aurea TaxID=192259 RepID=S8DI80_9LAMI|nr:hypothetical protein M569_15693 [Genlisea aurea]
MEDLSAVFTADGDFFDGGGGEDIETILDVACAASYSGSPDVLRREIASSVVSRPAESASAAGREMTFLPLHFVA